MLKLQCLSCSAGLPGLVQAYQSCIQSVQLYGPTNISPIINHVAHFAQQAAQTPTASVSSERLRVIRLSVLLQSSITLIASLTSLVNLLNANIASRSLVSYQILEAKS